MLDERQVSDCFSRADASRFRLSRGLFADALQASVSRAFAGQSPDRAAIDRYLAALHVDDLAIACSCAAGDEGAWEYFVRTYRAILYKAAEAIDPTGGAHDLADSVYAELFGLQEGSTGRRSLFRYFHGRSSLATWLRAVLAQRHVDRIRERRRLDPLPDDEALPTAAVVPNPERESFVAMTTAALRSALAQLAPADRLRLSSYYAGRMTLAQVGRLTGEHEATVSRQLARTRAAIRARVEAELRDVHGLDEPTITECFRSVAEDPGPLDLTALLDRKNLGPERSKDGTCV